MDKEDVVHLNKGRLLSHKKEWNNAIWSNMDASRDYHIERSKSDEKKNLIGKHLNAESKNMIQMNLFTKQKQTHRHKKKK